MLYIFKYTEFFPLIHEFRQTFILGKLNIEHQSTTEYQIIIQTITTKH